MLNFEGQLKVNVGPIGANFSFLRDLSKGQPRSSAFQHEHHPVSVLAIMTLLIAGMALSLSLSLSPQRDHYLLSSSPPPPQRRPT